MMKLRMPDKYYRAAIILLLVSSIFIAIPLFIHIGDTTTAACVIAGMVFVMTGIFIFTLSGGEPMDPRLVGILTAQGSITLCRISSEVGIHGKAHFLPPRFTGKTRVMQLNQGSKPDGYKIFSEKSVLKTDPWGFLTEPSCDLLIQDLKERNAMVIPDQPLELAVLLNETIGDIFDFAYRVSATWNGNQVTITLYEYQFIESCQILRQNSPHCCNKYPCPVCSLCGVLIAEGMNEIITVEQCSSGPSSRDVTITFLITTTVQKHADTGSDNLH
jgi:hypothetical protein